MIKILPAYLFAFLLTFVLSEAPAQKLKPLGFSYDYSLPAETVLPQPCRFYSSVIKTDNVLSSPQRVLYLQDSVKRKQSARSNQQAALQEALQHDNQKIAKGIADEHFNLSSAVFFKKKSDPDFLILLEVGKLQYELIDKPEQESDTLFLLEYPAVASVTDKQMKKVFHSRSVSRNMDDFVITKKNMVLFFTPEEVVELKLHKRDQDLKQKIYQQAISRWSMKFFREAIEAASFELNEHLTDYNQFSFALYSAKGKHDYTALERAEVLMREIELARRLNPRTEMTDEEEVLKLKEAIAIWENELTTEDTADKKARINYVVGEGLRYNCALAYMLLKDFNMAKEYINRMNTTSPNFIGKPEHFIPQFARELKSVIQVSEVRLKTKI